MTKIPYQCYHYLYKVVPIIYQVPYLNQYYHDTMCNSTSYQWYIFKHLIDGEISKRDVNVTVGTRVILHRIKL